MQINVDLIYPIGSLYITTDTSFNPNIKFGGTWARLEGDVYLKNVPSSSSQPIGNYGGTSSNHKIPETSMPNHAHDVKAFGYGSGITLGDQTWGWGSGVVPKDGNSAGAHIYAVEKDNIWGTTPYYPYYYGVICWHRTA